MTQMLPLDAVPDTEHMSESPVPTPPTHSEDRDGFVGFTRRTRSAMALVFASFPISLAAFVVLFTAFVMSASLFVLVGGIPLMVGTLWLSQWFGHRERQRFGAAGYRIAGPTAFGRSTSMDAGFRSWFRSLGNTDAWRALVYGITTLWLSVVTFSIALTWLAIALGGTTVWVWSRFIPDYNNDYSGVPESLRSSLEFLNTHYGQFIVGIFFLVTLPFVMRGLAATHAGWAHLWLGTSRVAELEGQVESLTIRRAVAAEAEAQAMRRVERDIHDGPQQRLVRLGMDLAAAERQLAQDPEAAAALLSEARTQTKDALDELRSLSRGIAPPVLIDRGLREALLGLVARNTVPTTLVFEAPTRKSTNENSSEDDEGTTAQGRPEVAPATIENAIYFLVAESLTNVAKHSGATSASVAVRALDDDQLSVEVTDNGVGGASIAKGHGLTGLADRVYGVDGTFRVTSPAGGPTTVTASFPV